MRFRRKATATAVAFVAALGVALAGCGSGGGTDAAGGSDQIPTTVPFDGDVDALLDRLYEQAVEAGETQVNIYGPGEDAKQPLWDAWAERFPEIEVRVTVVGGGDLQARLEQEHASRQHIADIVSIGDSSMMNFYEAGFFAPFTPPNMEGVPDDLRGPEDAFHATSCQAYGILYNSNRLSEADAPEGYADLLDPAYDGRIVMGDPREPGGTAYILHRIATDPEFGMEWVRNFASNGVTVLEGVEEQEIGARIARGEWDIMAFYPGHQLPEEGPIEFVFPTEGGSNINCHFAGIVDGAPNPNAAQLLKTWMYTEQYQELGRDEGIFFPVTPGLGDGPAGFPPLEDIDRIRPLSFEEVTEQDQYREQFVEVFGGDG